MLMVGTPHFSPRGYGVLVVRSTMAGFPLLPWLPWKSRLDPLCPMPWAPVAQHPEVGSWHKVDLDTPAFDPAP
jgi:hypothetical protein